MNQPAVLRRGDRGEAVRDLRARLAATGSELVPGDVFDPALDDAVRAFQQRRGLRVDGICGPETWGALVESGFRLGDRLLFVARPMLRGDDVADLQRRLNALGFDAGREDGILGPETESALRQFQRNAGTTADGICGPATIDALARVGGLAAGSVASVRERETLRRAPPRVRGSRVFVVAEPSVAALGHAVVDAMRDLGALVGLDTSGDDPSALAAAANLFRAGAFVALTTGSDLKARCAYFESGTFRSEAGLCLAARMTEALRTVLPDVEDPAGRTYRFLRETRMAAVVCELGNQDRTPAPREPGAHLDRFTAALVEGFRRGIEEPVDPPDAGSTASP